MSRAANRIAGEAVASAPTWLQQFAERISEALHSAEAIAPLGCHFHREQGGEKPEWEITLFVSSTEIYGGSQDGRRGVSRFFLDVHAVTQVFDAVENIYWQAHRMADDDDVGPHIGVEGLVEGQRVWLRFTANPPAQFEQQPGRIVDLLAQAVNDRW